MTEDYEELACPETNTFKVGDLVRVYDGQIMFNAIVANVGIAMNELTADHYESYRPYSFKQCRPLKKKATEYLEAKEKE